jgi:exodeoxyribonuclease-3
MRVGSCRLARVKLATWNINSIRARTDRLVTWLSSERPDVLCLQETKVEDSGFPMAALTSLGYEVAIYGQRSYNGVAIASKTPLSDVSRGFGDGEADDEARLIAATVDGLRVICVYVPNGQDLASEKFGYKLAWYKRLRRYLDTHAKATDRLVVCGDTNVTFDDLDVSQPEKWAGQIHCSPREREAFGEIIGFGLVDLFRAHHPAGRVYSWWDYRGVSFFKDQGLRIDYILATPSVAEQCTACTIDRNARKGQDASDHAPVIATI